MMDSAVLLPERLCSATLVGEKLDCVHVVQEEFFYFCLAPNVSVGHYRANQRLLELQLMPEAVMMHAMQI